MQCLKIKNLQRTEGHSWCTFVSQRAPAEGQEGTGQGMVCTKPNLSLATAPAPSPLQLLCQFSAGQTSPKRLKFLFCSQGNTKHRLCINIAAFSTRRFVLAPALCSLLPCLPLPERMRSARRLPKNTPAGNCRGWRAENCRDAARPPPGKEHAGSCESSQTSPPARAGKENPPGSANEGASLRKVPRVPARRQLFIRPLKNWKLLVEN